ncbi:S-(hydroxymethyl)mycothiol dehydrogenase [Roseivivax jejudonensis]|uniref:S-(Hydroxymethyl)mycothiol dehydrogenase n=1 Tax=Roseivivax jejudonensis TaxID=1529041 RepID=A0A1X6ZG79_9RHOB|nr:alcohol dehydrogenase catalytic domain-containing protein [Roseivivax jejudonensis]SLN50266.1 S-(hydroxymethyl)mycothiol dehydrogenase [Roseivivax jejudonensis]
MPRIRAAVCTAFGAPLEIEELDLRAPGPGEIEVAIEAVAICHSDIHYAEGSFPSRLPCVLGHEAAGRVTAHGPGVTGPAIGSRVVVTLVRFCGACPACLSGHSTICRDFDRADTPLARPDGTPVWNEMETAAFAERVVVHATQCVAVTEEIPADRAALLGCGVVTGVGAVVNAGALRPGEDVVVIGAGGVGLNAIQGARIAGARRIVAVDVSQSKLSDAAAFGATDGVLATDPSPWRRVAKALGRAADLCIVTVGATAAYDAAPRYVGWGGRIVMVGMPAAGETAAYEPLKAAFTGQRLIGSKMGDAVIARDIPWMADLYAQGRLELDALVSRHWTFDQINDAMADTEAGGARRNVIVF